MIRIKIILRSMLSLPVVREAQDHYTIVLCTLLYFGVLFFVLKTLKYNKDRYGN